MKSKIVVVLPFLFSCLPPVNCAFAGKNTADTSFSNTPKHKRSHKQAFDPKKLEELASSFSFNSNLGREDNGSKTVTPGEKEELSGAMADSGMKADSTVKIPKARRNSLIVKEIPQAAMYGSASENDHKNDQEEQQLCPCTLL